MRKSQRSVRLSKEAQKILGRKVVRLTLNPVLLALSHEHVDWSGRERESGKLRPSDIALKARERFPDLPLSWAVEGCLALLIAGDKGLLKPLTVVPYSMLPESPRFDLIQFLREAGRHNIRYLLVGRWAVAQHGAPFVLFYD